MLGDNLCIVNPLVIIKFSAAMAQLVLTADNRTDEKRGLLGYYAASGGNILTTFRDNLSIPSSGVENPKESLLWHYGVYIGKSVIPEYGAGSRPETSVINFHYSLRNNSEERSSQLHRCGSL